MQVPSILYSVNKTFFTTATIFIQKCCGLYIALSVELEPEISQRRGPSPLNNQPIGRVIPPLSTSTTQQTNPEWIVPIWGGSTTLSNRARRHWSCSQSICGAVYFGQSSVGTLQIRKLWCFEWCWCCTWRNDSNDVVVMDVAKCSKSCLMIFGWLFEGMCYWEGVCKIKRNGITVRRSSEGVVLLVGICFNLISHQHRREILG